MSPTLTSAFFCLFFFFFGLAALFYRIFYPVTLVDIVRFGAENTLFCLLIVFVYYIVVLIIIIE